MAVGAGEEVEYPAKGLKGIWTERKFKDFIECLWNHVRRIVISEY